MEIVKYRVKYCILITIFEYNIILIFRWILKKKPKINFIWKITTQVLIIIIEQIRSVDKIYKFTEEDIKSLRLYKLLDYILWK